MAIEYRINDTTLDAASFLDLVGRVWPGQYDPHLTEAALRHTLNITAWDGPHLVGCVRVLTDGYLYSAVPDILVDPHYQHHGIGGRLMELAWDHSPTSLLVGAQPGSETFFARLGFERTTPSLIRRKPRPAAARPWRFT